MSRIGTLMRCIVRKETRGIDNLPACLLGWEAEDDRGLLCGCD